jgi:hypothetical protein
MALRVISLRGSSSVVFGATNGNPARRPSQAGLRADPEHENTERHRDWVRPTNAGGGGVFPALKAAFSRSR